MVSPQIYIFFRRKTDIGSVVLHQICVSQFFYSLLKKQCAHFLDLYMSSYLWYNIWFLRWSSGVFRLAHATAFDEHVVLTGERYRAERDNEKQIGNVGLGAFATNDVTLRGSVFAGARNVERGLALINMYSFFIVSNKCRNKLTTFCYKFYKKSKYISLIVHEKNVYTICIVNIKNLHNTICTKQQ